MASATWALRAGWSGSIRDVRGRPARPGPAAAAAQRLGLRRLGRAEDAEVELARRRLAALEDGDLRGAEARGRRAAHGSPSTTLWWMAPKSEPSGPSIPMVTALPGLRNGVRGAPCSRVSTTLCSAMQA